MEKYGNRFTFNLGNFQNDIERYIGKITDIKLIYVDCDKGVDKIIMVDKSYLNKFQYKPFSTSYVKGLLYNRDKLLGKLLTDTINV